MTSDLQLDKIELTVEEGKVPVARLWGPGAWSLVQSFIGSRVHYGGVVLGNSGLHAPRTVEAEVDGIRLVVGAVDSVEDLELDAVTP